MSEPRFQLRGLQEDGVTDSGELRHVDTLEEAMELFLEGGWWKLSWTRPNGRRVRLLKEGNRIQITDPGDISTILSKERGYENH